MESKWDTDAGTVLDATFKGQCHEILDPSFCLKH